jgi:hypothetical protein
MEIYNLTVAILHEGPAQAETGPWVLHRSRRSVFAAQATLSMPDCIVSHVLPAYANTWAPVPYERGVRQEQQSGGGSQLGVLGLALRDGTKGAHIHGAILCFVRGSMLDLFHKW